jgi:hypothetical protein
MSKGVEELRFKIHKHLNLFGGLSFVKMSQHHFKLSRCFYTTRFFVAKHFRFCKAHPSRTPRPLLQSSLKKILFDVVPETERDGEKNEEWNQHFDKMSTNSQNLK